MSYHKEYDHTVQDIWEAIGIKESLVKETADMVNSMFEQLNRPSILIEALEKSVMERPELLRPMIVIIAGAITKQHFEIKEKINMLSTLGDALKNIVEELKVENNSNNELEQKENSKNKDGLH